jgi:hypothetical protein
MEASNPTDFVRAFDSAWNAGDDQAILALFTSDAQVRLDYSPAGSVVYQGEEGLGKFVSTHLPRL